MKKLLPIFILSLLLTSCATLSAKPSNTYSNMWRDCESPECHYEEQNEARSVLSTITGVEYEPITHNCKKCISHKCITCYNLWDSEARQVVFITRDNFTNEITMHLNATDTFIHDVITLETDCYFEDGSRDITDVCWYTKGGLCVRIDWLLGHIKFIED